MGSLDDQTNAEAQARYNEWEAQYLTLSPDANIPMIVYFSISSNGLANLTGSGLDGAMRCSIVTRERALALALEALENG